MSLFSGLNIILTAWIIDFADIGCIISSGTQGMFYYSRVGGGLISRAGGGGGSGGGPCAVKESCSEAHSGLAVLKHDWWRDDLLTVWLFVTPVCITSATASCCCHLSLEITIEFLTSHHVMWNRQQCKVRNRLGSSCFKTAAFVLTVELLALQKLFVQSEVVQKTIQQKRHGLIIDST